MKKLLFIYILLVSSALHAQEAEEPKREWRFYIETLDSFAPDVQRFDRNMELGGRRLETYPTDLFEVEGDWLGFIPIYTVGYANGKYGVKGSFRRMAFKEQHVRACYDDEKACNFSALIPSAFDSKPSNPLDDYINNIVNQHIPKPVPSQVFEFDAGGSYRAYTVGFSRIFSEGGPVLEWASPYITLGAAFVEERHHYRGDIERDEEFSGIAPMFGFGFRLYNFDRMKVAFNYTIIPEVNGSSGLAELGIGMEIVF
ncbi:MAG: hypothetical protein LBL52_00815 [Rickettsiales bacterium]|jgi:hypothetical protein|nr:hypothetical protein [Rickettsiales bacterium]